MRAKPEYRDRDETEVTVLDVLAERDDDGMTVLAIRAEVDADIDTLETALENLKDDALIEARRNNGRTVIAVEDHVIGPDSTDTDSDDFFDQIRRRFPL
jgi:predicted transcriptional regulator